MSSKSASQRKAAPRQYTPQQPTSTTSQSASKSSKSGQQQSKSNKSGQSQAKSGKGMQQKAARKHRGPWLTVALVLVTIGAIVDAVVPFLYRKNTIEITNPYLIGGALLVGVVGLTGAIAMWFWKQWGIYLFVASVFGSMVLGLMVYPSMFAAFHAFIPLLILGAAFSVEKSLPMFDRR